MNVNYIFSVHKIRDNYVYFPIVKDKFQIGIINGDTGAAFSECLIHYYNNVQASKYLSKQLGMTEKEAGTEYLIFLEDLEAKGLLEQKKKKSSPSIRSGSIVGDLTVLNRCGKGKDGYSLWLCRCVCGNTISLDTRTLQRRTVLDCGCKNRNHLPHGRKNLTGQRFGKLICLRPSEEADQHGGTQWVCKCDCGKECLASTHQLTSGYKKSCGCLRYPPIKDYVGKRFGKLTVTEYAGKIHGVHYWRCQCDCGNTTEVCQTNLQNGHTKSCGCLQDNSISKNLRLIDGTSITFLESRKGKLLSTNKSGITGVYRTKRGKWVAQITFKRKTYYLGSYDTKEDAAKARQRGEEMHDSFLEWYYETYQQDQTDHCDEKNSEELCVGNPKNISISEHTTERKQ